jgi:hypothetical protein
MAGRFDRFSQEELKTIYDGLQSEADSDDPDPEIQMRVASAERLAVEVEADFRRKFGRGIFGTWR